MSDGTAADFVSVMTGTSVSSASSPEQLTRLHGAAATRKAAAAAAKNGDSRLWVCEQNEWVNSDFPELPPPYQKCCK